MVQISQKFPHLNFPILEVPKLSYMSVLADTGSRLNLGNIEYHRSVSYHQPNLVLKFEYLKNLDDVDPLNISGVDGGKESEQGRGGGRSYHSNYLQKPLFGRRKTGESIPRSRRRGGT